MIDELTRSILGPQSHVPENQLRPRREIADMMVAWPRADVPAQACPGGRIGAIVPAASLSWY